MATVVRSKYCLELKEDVKKRYEEKMKVADCLKDPYCYLECKKSISNALEWTEWPDVSFADIYNYLVLTVSSYTRDQLKAYKSLDGYNFFINGWVNDVTVLNTGKPRNFLFLSHVKHSQSLSLTPLKVWLVVTVDGEVVCGHYTCMAGLGEACSHVAAVLFAAEANSITKRQFSSTSLPCSWLPPTFRTVKFAEISSIDFSTPKHKRTLSASDSGKGKKVKLDIPPPTEDELKEYYSRLMKTKGRPALLSLVPGLNDSFIPKYVSGLLPKPLTHLYDEDALSLPFPDLLKKCEQIYDEVSISVEQAKMVEQETRKQSNSKIWYAQRSGRVTASRLYGILHTRQSKPSVSLLKAICYPGAASFFSKACAYGCQHEDEARSIYGEMMKKDHDSFTISQCGLLLDPTNPFIGASPDGVVQCTCCGTGVIEIKCPYSCKEKQFNERAEDRSFFLEKDASGSLVLKKEHAYYYQVQLQMKLFGANYCDFVVWKEDNTIRQRIPFDISFISNALNKIPAFVKSCVLPELVGKYFTKPAETPEDSPDSNVVIANSPTTDLDLLDDDTLDDVFDDLHANNDSQVVDVDICSSDNLPLTSSLLQEDGDTGITATYDLAANTSMCDLNSNSPVVSVDDHMHQDQITDSQATIDSSNDSADDGPWCYCQEDKPDEPMVICESEHCLIQWFHLSCLDLTLEQLPDDDWFCPDCIVRMS